MTSASDLDHGSLTDDWDRYGASFGQLPLHLQKIEPQILTRLSRLVGECVARGSPMTKDELVETGYLHPVDGLFF